MADNLTAITKIGETGKVITAVLKESDANGALVPKNLTGYTDIKMQVETRSGRVILDQVACVADPDQAANPGRITCTTDITVDEHPNLVPGTHRLEFSGLNSNGKKRYWPMNAKQEKTYGTFIVQNPLA